MKVIKAVNTLKKHNGERPYNRRFHIFPMITYHIDGCDRMLEIGGLFGSAEIYLGYKKDY